MMLYDIYYRESRAMDSSIPLPKAASDMDRAINTNADRHELRAVRMADKTYDWTREVVSYAIAAPAAILAPVTYRPPKEELARVKTALRLIDWRTDEPYATTTVQMRVEDVESNRGALPAGWSLVR